MLDSSSGSYHFTGLGVLPPVMPYEGPAVRVAFESNPDLQGAWDWSAASPLTPVRLS